MIFEILARSTGSLTELNAFMIAFIILSKENESFEPSRLVIVKLLIFIRMIVELVVR